MTLLKILKGWLEIPAGLVSGSHGCEVVETSHPWDDEYSPTPEGWAFHHDTCVWTYRGENIFSPDTEEAIVVEMTNVWVSSDTQEINKVNPGESWVEIVTRKDGQEDPSYEAYRRSWRPVVMVVAKATLRDGRIMYFQIHDPGGCK